MHATEYIDMTLCFSVVLLQGVRMSADSEVVDKKEAPEADMNNDSLVTEFTGVTSHVSTSDDYHTPQYIEKVVEVVPNDLQDVKKDPVDDECEADYYYNRIVTEFTDVISHVSTSDDYHTPQYIEKVVEVVPDDLQDVKKEPADDEYEADYHYYYCYSVKV